LKKLRKINLGIVSQNSDLEQPAEKDLYQLGTLAKIIKIIKLPEEYYSHYQRISQI
jgi:ATP-dependent Lon protease